MRVIIHTGLDIFFEHFVKLLSKNDHNGHSFVKIKCIALNIFNTSFTHN